MYVAYHPQSDGLTEHANCTVTQMLCQCIHPNQKYWVTKLAAIKFAINSAQSESAMSAHDSILAACVKQTRDANRKWQATPFNKNDMVYLSTKNIPFPKGLVDS